jgi:ribonuclease E
VIVAGDAAYQEAKDFMRMLMPSHARNVKAYRDPQPLFTRYTIESQLDAMFSPVVQLRSGGYIVLNQTEALVAIDVNSGRATREHHIEDTALKTNLEASEEIARQLRLRDLAGLVVIDFIDMDEKRNNRAVERRLKDALKNDRARIQVGRISHFGLMEMSRQRIRTSVLESSTDKCPTCGGTGHVRSVSSLTLQLLRVIDETLLRSGTHNLVVRTGPDVALYILNHKRGHLRDLEQRFQITITVTADNTITAQQPFIIEKGELVHSAEQARAIAAQGVAGAPVIAEDAEDELAAMDEAAEEIETGETVDAELEVAHGDDATDDEAPELREGVKRRRRRRRRGGRSGEREATPGRGDAVDADSGEAMPLEADHEDEVVQTDASEGGAAAAHEARGDNGDEANRRRRRRGRRGGRRNRRDRKDSAGGAEQGPEHENVAEAPDHANGDVDHAPPPYEPSYGAHTPEPPAPEAQPSSAAPAAEAESPRRRSTVRERVTFVAEIGETSPAASAQQAEQAAAPPEPAETEASKPRRTGWWAKRLLGN